MAYGVKIRDASGNILTMTPSIFSIISAGNLTISKELREDNTYGPNAILLGNASISESDIGTFIDTSKTGYIDIHLLQTTISNGATEYMFSFYMKGPYAFNYYTRNEGTGVMSSWTPGDHSSLTQYDELMSVYPEAFWDKKGASSFNKVQLFATMLHHTYDSSETAWVNAYAFGQEGTTGVDYGVYMRYYQGARNHIQA